MELYTELSIEECHERLYLNVILLTSYKVTSNKLCTDKHKFIHAELVFYEL